MMLKTNDNIRGAAPQGEDMEKLKEYKEFVAEHFPKHKKWILTILL